MSPGKTKCFSTVSCYHNCTEVHTVGMKNQSLEYKKERRAIQEPEFTYAIINLFETL